MKLPIGYKGEMEKEKVKLTNKLRSFVIVSGVIAVFAITVVSWLYYRTAGRVQIQFDIHQNQELIRLSTYSEPPQFAIWLENADTHKLMTVFVTRRVSVGDWEGKTNVPDALPRWFELFRGKNKSHSVIIDDKYDAVTGATPKENYFSIRAEVNPGSRWICFIEMNLAGDYNDAFPPIDLQSLKEDEFACGQPALLYKATITAIEGMQYTPELFGQSIWEDGENWIEPIDERITTAKNVFDTIQISIIRPKPKLIDKNKSTYNDE